MVKRSYLFTVRAELINLIYTGEGDIIAPIYILYNNFVIQ